MMLIYRTEFPQVNSWGSELGDLAWLGYLTMGARLKTKYLS